MKQKMIRFIAAAVLLSIVALSTLCFSACIDKNADDEQDLTPPVVDVDNGGHVIAPPVSETPPPVVEVDLSEIGAYNLPESFFLSVKAADIIYNYAKLNGQYYVGEIENGILVSAKLLLKNGSDYNLFAAGTEDDEFVWGAAETVLLEDYENMAYEMFSDILLKVASEGSETLAVGDKQIVCTRYTMNSGSATTDYLFGEGYDVCLKRKSTHISGWTSEWTATLFETSISEWPDFVNPPVNLP